MCGFIIPLKSQYFYDEKDILFIIRPNNCNHAINEISSDRDQQWIN